MKKRTTASKKAPAGKRTAVSKKGTFTRTSRIAKAAGRVEKLGSSKLSTKQIGALQATVRVTAMQPTQVQGFILSQDENGVVLRQSKSSGSSKPAVKHYMAKDILACTGTVNSVGVLTVLAQSDVRDLCLRRASVEFDGSNVIATDNDTGDVITINRNLPGINVDIVVIEE